MKLLYQFFFLTFLLISISLVSSTTSITGNFVYDNPNLPHLNPTINQSLVTVNNSIYWQGYTPTTLPHNILAGIQGGSPGQYYHLNQSLFNQVVSYAFSWITGENVAYVNQTNYWNSSQYFLSNVTFNNNVNIGGNLNVNGTITGTINGTISTANFSYFSNYSNTAGQSNFSYYSNNSNYLDGYNSTTLPHNQLAGLQGGNPSLNEFYHLDLIQYQEVTNFTNSTSQTFVPYQGAIKNVNLTGFNITASNMFVPIGGSVNWDNNITANGTTVAYMRYNTTSMRLEMWVNGRIQQDWGNSTTIYGTATFQSDAFFQNLSGVGLLINTNVVVDGNIMANKNISGAYLFAGNVCYSDGTNCTSINSTLANLTSLIMDINQTLTYQIINLTNLVYFINETNWNYTTAVNQSLTNQINQTNYQISQVNSSLYNLIVNVNGTLYNYTFSVNQSLTDLINNETFYRISNDTYLLNLINNETLYRISNDTYLLNLINNETAYRISNDSYLLNLTLSINGTLYNYTFIVNQSLTDLINNETAYRISNDSYLQNQINNITTNLSNNFYDKLHNVTPPTNMTFTLGNSTNWWSAIYVGTINSMSMFIGTINAVTINTISLNATNITVGNVYAGNLSGILPWSNLTGIPYYLNATNSIYLYNNNGTVFFNETQLNQTITSFQVWTSLNGTVYLVNPLNHVAIGLNSTNATLEVKGNSTNIPITVCNGTVACYRFEEGSGTIALDSSQYLNLGFIKSDTYAASKGSNGTGNYSLDSVLANGYMVANDQPQIAITDNLTLSAWINITVNSNNNYIIVKNNDKTLQNGYMLYLQGDRKLYFTVIRNGVTVSNLRTVDAATLVQGTGWHHVAATINGTNVALYVDGVLKPSQAGGQGFAGVSTDLFVGVDGTVTKYFNGYIDEVGIFNSVLTASQISTLFNTGFTFANTTFPGFSNNPFMITKTISGDIVVVDRYGRVGINNPNPTATLDVNGTINMVEGHVSKDLFIGGTLIGGSPVKVSGGLIIFGGDVNGSESNAYFANMYDIPTIDSTFLNKTEAQTNYIPYTGAISDINFTGVNMTAGNILIPLGNYISWDVNITPNISLAYMKYNLNSSRLEMWVNGKIQQDWGNSTTIYGKATFEADAFFQNLSGEGLFVNTNMIVDGNILAFQNITGQSIFAGNICYSDGTNCTAFNSTVANLSTYIFEVNQSLSYQIMNLTDTVNFLNATLTGMINNETQYRIANDSYLQDQINNLSFNLTNFYNKNESDGRYAQLNNSNTFYGNQTPGLNDTYYLGNSTNMWAYVYSNVINAISMTLMTLNVNWINVGTINATTIYATNLDVSNLNASLNWSNIQNIPYYLNATSGSYLYNINGTVYFNETLNNETITAIANVNAFQQTVIVNVSGGVGFNISTPINYYLTQLIVTAPDNTTTFNFQATQNNATGFMIDKNREQHTGHWNIKKGYSLTNDTIYLSITNSSQDGAYTIIIKYINSKFTYP